MSSQNSPIVVGVDGSGVSATLLRWAAADALGKGAPLHVVQVSKPQVLRMFAPEPVWPSGAVSTDDEPREHHLKQLVAEALADLPVEHTVEVAHGDPAGVLIDIAGQRSAQLLVVGRRGWGGITRLLLGSVSDKCAVHAPCPVVVIGPAADTETPAEPIIIVGVDGSPDSERALHWAAQEASHSGTTVVAVSVWELAEPPSDSLAGIIPALIDGREEILADVAAGLEQAVARIRPDFPDVTIETVTVEGEATDELLKLAKARSAQLLVVGSRGMGGFASLLLGSVAKQALQYAACPVAIIR